MLVFVSDLHITNKTSGVQHLEASAFELALPAIARQASSKDGQPAQEVTFVFLGDIFDLIRTDYWFTHPGVRPWDLPPGSLPDNDSAVAQHCEVLLRDILEKNRAIFDIWSNPLKGSRYGFELEPKRIYLAGNHDRFCNQFPRLRQIVIESLGLNHGRETPLDPNEPFPLSYWNEEYQTFGRHGHEWDEYNFEHVHDWKRASGLDLPLEHYFEVPIGDVIASEIACRLPGEMREALVQYGGIPAADIERIVEHMKTIDDVRPTAAILPWLVDSINTQQAMTTNKDVLLPILTSVIHRIVGDFDSLTFTQEWMRKHDAFLPLDYVDRLQGAVAALRNLNVRTLERILRMADTSPSRAAEALLRLVPCIDDALTNDNYAGRAAEDFKRLGDLGYKPLYILYGHTHAAEQIPIDTPSGEACQVYLNTGTWRPLYRQARSGIGFIRWKNLNYTIIYHPERDPGSQAANSRQPTFETWGGSLLDPLT